MTILELQENPIDIFSSYVCEDIARKEVEIEIDLHAQDLRRDFAECVKGIE